MNEDRSATVANKVTINIPVEDAAEASRLLSSVISAEVLVEDGPRYVLLNVSGTRVAFVAGPEDITRGRPALAVEVADVDVNAVAEAAAAHRLASHRGRHSSDRFVVIDLPAGADLIYYTRKPAPTSRSGSAALPRTDSHRFPR